MPPRPSELLPLHCASSAGVSLRIDALQARLLAAIGNQESVNIGQQQQPVGFDGRGQQRTQFVVVAEGAFQFAYRDAVVFIDDRHHAQREQFCQCVLQIAIAHGRGEVVAREQQLRDDFLAEEQALVGVHQLALADGGAGLHARDIAGALSSDEARHAGGDRARGDDQVFVFREVELIDHAAQQVDVDLPAGGDETGADFDDTIFGHGTLVAAVVATDRGTTSLSCR